MSTRYGEGQPVRLIEGEAAEGSNKGTTLLGAVVSERYVGDNWCGGSTSSLSLSFSQSFLCLVLVLCFPGGPANAERDASFFFFKKKESEILAQAVSVRDCVCRRGGVMVALREVKLAAINVPAPHYGRPATRSNRATSPMGRCEHVSCHLHGFLPNSPRLLDLIDCSVLQVRRSGFRPAASASPALVEA